MEIFDLFFTLTPQPCNPRTSAVELHTSNQVAQTGLMVHSSFFFFFANKELRIAFSYTEQRASLVAQMVKNPPTMQETWVLSLGGEDALEKGTPIHSSMLAWEIP